MPNLKDLRVRISSVKSTQKITSAMKMVAASKLRRAQGAVEAARPYAERMERMTKSLAKAVGTGEGAPKLLAGRGKDDVHLLVVVTSDRGLCGGFNGSIVREARRRVHALELDGKTVKILCVGRKARDGLKRDYKRLIIDTIENVGRSGINFEEADVLGRRIRSMFEEEEFDVCTMIYNRFQSAIAQIVTVQQVIPLSIEVDAKDVAEEEEETLMPANLRPVYEYEPSEEDILSALLPRNLSVQLFRAYLESFASEQGARMTAMDNATRNAGEMIDDLTMTYNRTRQAYITKELIEIISGAEAL
ncbi:MAG: F0F1 ATP synthase subunit gamma [Rhodospirillales bacterium]|nr:F0F1 ATP synthase subunit gamma [Rhodospirillales bacterium]MCW9003189.1 F0F1 ATP synthase subunit gamma [Rhodospirillales bacterium]MCW9040431.1 F0F1 ATP synthase subunit gamma [Rhodospirillales bacterium]